VIIAIRQILSTREAPRVAVNQARLRITDVARLEDPAAHVAALIRAGETIIDENEPCSAVTDRKRQIGAHNHAPSVVWSPVPSDLAFEITAARFQGLRLCLVLR